MKIWDKPLNHDPKEEQRSDCRFNGKSQSMNAKVIGILKRGLIVGMKNRIPSFIAEPSGTKYL